MNILEIAARVLDALPQELPQDIDTVLAKFPEREQHIVRKSVQMPPELYWPTAIAASVVASSLREHVTGELAAAYRAAALVYEELAWLSRFFADDVAVSAASAAETLDVTRQSAQKALDAAVKMGLLTRRRYKNKETYHPLVLERPPIDKTTDSEGSANVVAGASPSDACDGPDWLF